MTFDWWTLALQAINVLILIWLLGRFFYRPVAAVIEKRQADAKKLLSDAKASREEAEKAKAEVTATRKGFAAEHDKIISDARVEAQSQRVALLEEARKQAEALKSENEAAWKRERTAAEAALLQRAGALAVEIARRLVGRLPKDAATKLFVESLCARLRSLPQSVRELLVAAAVRGAKLEILTASPLSEDTKKLCADALAEAAGRKVELSFGTDASLITGIEIRGPEIALNDSFGNDLDNILKELSRDAGNSAET